MTQEPKGKRVFISYAHKDEALRKRLDTHLSLMQRQGLIQTWHDRQIQAGTNWAEAIDTQLEEASVILLLISPDFLASDYCYDKELQRAVERHTRGEARVIPVILRPCDWHSAPFGALQAVPRDGKAITSWKNRDEAFADVATGLRKAMIEVSTHQPSVAHWRNEQQAPTPQKQEENVRQTRKDTEMQKIKILFLAANPRITPRLALDEEMRAIEQKLRAAEHRDAVLFQSAWAVRPDDLLQLLNQHQPHVVHFSGHGDGEGLSLAGEDGKERYVSTHALQSLFSTLKDNIQLVVLNACYSREQALALGETIDCVIGMKESIGDTAAIAFASSFYRAIGFGRSIQGAFEQGITSLLLEGITGEDIPELLVKKGTDATTIVLVKPTNP